MLQHGLWLVERITQKDWVFLQQSISLEMPPEHCAAASGASQMTKSLRLSQLPASWLAALLFLSLRFPSKSPTTSSEGNGGNSTNRNLWWRNEGQWPRDVASFSILSRHLVDGSYWLEIQFTRSLKEDENQRKTDKRSCWNIVVVPHLESAMKREKENTLWSKELKRKLAELYSWESRIESWEIKRLTGWQQVGCQVNSGSSEKGIL